MQTGRRQAFWGFRYNSADLNVTCLEEIPVKIEITRTDLFFMMMTAGVFGGGLAAVVSIVLC